MRIVLMLAVDKSPVAATAPAPAWSSDVPTSCFLDALAGYAQKRRVHHCPYHARFAYHPLAERRRAMRAGG
jgi:hypothetical protein